MSLKRVMGSCVATVILAFAAGLLIGSTARAEPIKPSRDDREVIVQLHLANRDRVKEECANMGAPRIGVEGGCNKVYLDRSPKVCVVWAPRPIAVEDRERFEILGHEALHCFIGQFHTVAF